MTVPQRLGKYACVEIERRYLLRQLPAGLSEDAPPRRILDCYIAGTRLRLRQMTDHPSGEVIWKLGQKFRAAGQSALETTITNLGLNEQEFRVLRSLGGNEIIKDRYLHSDQGNQYGIDLFRGPLLGLILAELEFNTREEAAVLSPPPFAFSEVTDDADFTGGSLAAMNREALQALLEKYFGLGD